MDEVKSQLPREAIEESAKRMGFIGHPLRLRILEFLDVTGPSNVSSIVKAVDSEQVIVSQALKRLKRDKMVKSNRNSRFIIYSLSEQSKKLFVCMRRKYGRDNNQPEWENPEFKKILPVDFVTGVASKIKFMAHPDKIRILEYILWKGPSTVSDIINGVKCERIKVSQLLKQLKNKGFVSSTRNGRFIIYSIAIDLPKTMINCMHKNYNSLEDKSKF